MSTPTTCIICGAPGIVWRAWIPYATVSARAGFLCVEHSRISKAEFDEAMFRAHPAVAAYRDRNRKQYAKDMEEMELKANRGRKPTLRPAMPPQLTEKPVEAPEIEITTPDTFTFEPERQP
jgi:hypothetical protein